MIGAKELKEDGYNISIETKNRTVDDSSVYKISWNR